MTPRAARRLNALIGIAHRQVIYMATGTLWHAARRLEKLARATEVGKFVQKLHALDIATGAARANSPVVIEANVPGTGRGSSDGVLHFNPAIQNSAKSPVGNASVPTRLSSCSRY